MRYKIIDWKDINSNPKLTKNDDFIVGDIGVNKIKLELGAEVEGYNVVMLLRRNIDVKPTIYQAKVLNSVCEFDIEETDIEKDTYEIYIRIYNGTKTYASSGLVYENKEGKRFYKFTVNKFLAGDAGAIIEELKKQIVNAETKDTELKETINNSNSTKLSLEETINNSNLAKTSLEGTVRDSITAKDNLNSTILNATDIKNKLNTAIDSGVVQENSLKAEIAKVPLEIKKLQDESTNQQGLVKGEGAKQVKAVTDTGVAEVSKVTAEGSKQTTRVTTEGNAQFSRVNSEGIKQVGLVTTEGTKQTKLVTDEGVKQLGVIATKGTEIIKVGNDKIEEIKKTGQLNFNTMLAFSEWLGNLTEYDAITLKRMNRRYSVFSETGELLHTYYWKAKSPKEYFDPRISLVIQGGENGLEYWNDLSDPMPIKIAGGKTLAECIAEETEDYIIYSDGQKVVLSRYVPGTYDLYLERLKETENNPQLYGLTEPTIDHAKMLNDINNEQLEKLAQSPMILPDSETPIQLTSRTIPIPIDFCCRVDKKTGEIYIGEGYENLAKAFYSGTESALYAVSKSDDYTYSIKTENGFKGGYFCVNRTILSNEGKFSVVFSSEYAIDARFYIKSSIDGSNKLATISNLKSGTIYNINEYSENLDFSKMFEMQLRLAFLDYREKDISIEVNSVVFKSTPKPFVKTIMPSGKMSILTNATEATHTFLAKGTGATYTANGSEISLNGNDKLTQFLTYKGLLTQEQVQAENNKKLYAYIP